MSVGLRRFTLCGGVPPGGSVTIRDTDRGPGRVVTDVNGLALASLLSPGTGPMPARLCPHRTFQPGFTFAS